MSYFSNKQHTKEYKFKKKNKFLDTKNQGKSVFLYLRIKKP